MRPEDALGPLLRLFQRDALLSQRIFKAGGGFDLDVNEGQAAQWICSS